MGMAEGRDWIQNTLGAEPFEQLATGLAGTELQSVLLEVMQHRASRRTERELLEQWQRDRFCAPASVDLRTSVALDAHLLAAADGFEGLELSPVAPLGACSVVALTSQNRVLSATRGTEVTSDPTNVLALECARRLRQAPTEPVHLATSHRVIRTQPVPKQAGHTQHFRLFALASAGAELEGHAFTVQTLLLHIRTLLAAFDRLEHHGYSFGERRVELLATPERATIAERIATELGTKATTALLEHAYYSGGIRYKLWVTAPDGTTLPLVDGGTFDWVAKLTSNRRAIFVATGAGAQLMALRFRV